MELRSISVLFSIIIGLSISHTNAKADGPHVDADVVDLTQAATRWSPELVGGQWGWRLTKYKVLSGAFKINGQTLLLLSAPARSAADSVLWDPLTGTGTHLNQDEWKSFFAMHEKDRVQTWMRPIRLQGGKVLQTRGWSLHCQALPFQYYEIIDSKNRVLNSVYIVHKLHDSKRVKYFICPESDSAQEHYMDVSWLMDFDFVAELRDGTLLFYSAWSSSELPIIRLDGILKQRTTLEGLVFVMSAAEINGDFKPADNDFDMYNSFIKILLKRLASKEVLELP